MSNSQQLRDMDNTTDGQLDEQETDDLPSSAAAEHWADLDPESEAAVPDEPQELELADGTPVRARLVKEGAIDEIRTRVQARHDADEAEISRRVVATLLREHYETPDLSFLDEEKIENAQAGYYDKFLNPIAPELAAQAGNL